MKTSYKAFAFVFILIGLYGCGSCIVTVDFYGHIVNTLSQAVTVEFRSGGNHVAGTMTLEPGQGSKEFIYRYQYEAHSKSGSCDDRSEMQSAELEFTNTTLSQYTICSTMMGGPTYAVLASGATCTGDYPITETRGW